MNKMMAFALEYMNMKPSDFWSSPPFLILNQMVLKSESMKEDKPDPMTRKEMIDMMRGATCQ